MGIFGARAPSPEQMVATWGHRMIVAGIDYNDFMETIPRIKVYWEDWCREWCVTAAVHEDLARMAEEYGSPISAGEACFQAALGYHYACLHFIWDHSRRSIWTEPGRLPGAALGGARPTRHGLCRLGREL